MRFALLALLSGCLYGKGTIEVVTSPEPADATYYMLTPEGGQCTAWGVGKNSIITAGHCCDEEGTYEFYTRDFRVIEGTVVKYVDEDEPVVKDACRIRTSTPVRFIPLAASMPEPGDYMHFYGYPKGSWVHSTGEYLGDADGPAPWNDHQTTAPCDRGASGSAMLNAAGEAWGILVRLHFTSDRIYPGSFGCVASPLEQILEVLE